MQTTSVIFHDPAQAGAAGGKIRFGPGTCGPQMTRDVG